MKKRGKKSRAEMSIASSNVHPIQRVPPPDTLTDEQANEWRGVVSSMPADWFPKETHGLLIQYCRHAVTALRVSQLIHQAETGEGWDLEAYDRLLKMQQRESSMIAALATKMRLSQQSSYNAKSSATAKGNRPSGPAPWE